MSEVNLEVLAKVKELLGEHFAGYVLTVEHDHEDETMSTLTFWGGGYNASLGMAHRTLKRISTEGNDERPEDDGDEWKAKI